MKGGKHLLPVKTGELVANMLVAKIFSRIFKGKDIHGEVIVKGLLIDKICSVIECHFSVTMTSMGGQHDLKLRII